MAHNAAKPMTAMATYAMSSMGQLPIRDVRASPSRQSMGRQLRKSLKRHEDLAPSQIDVTYEEIGLR
jgi:hypothetical protein